MIWIISLTSWLGLARLLLLGLYVCHVNSDYFFISFLSNFILLCLINWKLNYIVFSYQKKIFSQVIVIVLFIF